MNSLVNNPTVIVCCHPTKNAGDDALVPRGGGAFISEVDGNLAFILKGEDHTILKPHGKFRDVKITSMLFRHKVTTWAALEREQKIKYWAERDRKLCRPGAYEVVIEQEPGSGGKESAEATIRMLAGFKVVADKVTGSKEARADPFAAQVQGGNVNHLCLNPFPRRKLKSS